MKPLLSSFVLVLACICSIATAQDKSCNPLTSSCSPATGINTNNYFIDFTKTTSLPAGWTLANYENVTFGSNGVEFIYNKPGDAPYIWTEMFLFGHVEVVMQAASGVGIISSAVLISDDEDEIDWEFSGNNFGYQTGKVQTNYFGKGITGDYDRGTLPDCASPQTEIHTYTLDWSATTLTWSIDDNVVRTLLASNANDSDHQYPQSPMRLQLGLWNGGDPSNAAGTIQWATGGVPEDLSKAPFTMFVKSAKITTPQPCGSFEYTDKSGSYQSIKCLADAANSSSSSTVSSTTPSLNQTFTAATTQGTGMSQTSAPLTSTTIDEVAAPSLSNHLPQSPNPTPSSTTTVTVTLISVSAETPTIAHSTCTTAEAATSGGSTSVSSTDPVISISFTDPTPDPESTDTATETAPPSAAASSTLPTPDSTEPPTPTQTDTPSLTSPSTPLDSAFPPLSTNTEPIIMQSTSMSDPAETNPTSTSASAEPSTIFRAAASRLQAGVGLQFLTSVLKWTIGSLR